MLVGSNHLVCLDRLAWCVIYLYQSTHKPRWSLFHPIWRYQLIRCKTRKLLAALPFGKDSPELNDFVFGFFTLHTDKVADCIVACLSSFIHKLLILEKGSNAELNIDFLFL